MVPKTLNQRFGTFSSLLNELTVLICQSYVENLPDPNETIDISAGVGYKIEGEEKEE